MFKIIIFSIFLCFSTLIFSNENVVGETSSFNFYYFLVPLVFTNIFLFFVFIIWDKRQKKLIDRNRELHSQIVNLNEELDIKKRILEQISNTDRLTRLYNRNYIESNYSDILNESINSGNQFSILLFDIDRFKLVNDTYGHNVGDIVLETFGSIIKGFERKGDVSARWGGEEFIIICPNTSNDEAFQFAESLRKNIESHSFPEVGRCTTSIGVATNNGNESQTDLILRADKALYKAKDSGRNIVIRADIK